MESFNCFVKRQLFLFLPLWFTDVWHEILDTIRLSVVFGQFETTCQHPGNKCKPCFKAQANIKRTAPISVCNPVFCFLQGQAKLDFFDTVAAYSCEGEFVPELVGGC